MFKDMTKMLGRLVQSGRMESDVRSLAVYERYHASEGFRRAAGICFDKLKAAGLDADILTYAARDDLLYESQFAQDEWVCPEGWFALKDDPLHLIADRKALPCSVIQGSAAQPEEDRCFELTLAGADRAAVAGKVVLLRGPHPNDVKELFLDFGAVGVVCADRGEPGRADVVKWVSFTDPDLKDIF
ncbi:MAG: hypothetical protein LBO81_01515, partial [Clostridiales Family XIII bacterium]|nr:hypothetical protein [Clostridiales Family XIII bacterium]